MEGFCPGEIWSGDSVPGRIGPGIRSEEGRSGEAASCSYHIIIWYLDGLYPRKLCPSKNRVNMSEIIEFGGFRSGIMFMVIFIIDLFFLFLT